MGRTLLTMGLVLVVAGLLFLFLERGGFNPGRLPGDFVWRGKNVTFFAPLGTSLLISVVLSVVFYVISRLRR